MSTYSRGHRHNPSARAETKVPGKNLFAFPQTFTGVRPFASSLIPTGACRIPLLQRKLLIGQANDVYEQEADRVADEVMRMPEGSEVRSQESEVRDKKKAVQRKPT